MRQNGYDAARVFPLIYLLSGAAALIYEVLWLRLLALLMGHTAAATGIVLAAFMGGLAIGAWRGGRVAESLSPARALRVYALLEGAIAGCALLMPAALSSARPLLERAYADGAGASVFHLTLGALALVLMGIPAAAMGATYPLAVRWFAGVDDAAVRAGRLYAANTVGATLGAALAGFLLLPQLGLRGTTLVGVALNLTAGLGAWHLARNAVNSQPPTPNAQNAPLGNWELEVGRSRQLAAIAAGVSGFVVLVYQVMWTRILALVLGPTTYAFGAMLVAFIGGIAIGSALATWIVKRTRAPGAWLGGAMIAGAAAALAAGLAVDRLPLIMAPTAARPDVTFASIFTLQLTLVMATLLPMTIALGAVFPFALAVAAPGAGHAPRRVALVYAVNTAGAIAGALGGSLVLLPVIGIQSSLRLAAAVAAVSGALLFQRQRSKRGSIAAALTAAALIALAVVAPPWNHDRLSNGGYRFSSALAAGDFQIGLEAGRLRYYREGAAGTVSVRELPGALALAIDGKVDASNTGDMLTQKLLAHLPLLLHGSPRTVCVIGLGSGVTLGAALRHPITRADVVEISPEVVDASSFFAAENHDALADQRTRLIVGDGRSHLLLSRERYDVIVSEPSNPWMAGVSTLFTREFFAAARERLAPGGILTQWAHTYNITDEDIRSIVATFLSVFPDGTAWLVGDADLLLVGAAAPLEALERGLAEAWNRPGVAADLEEVAVRDPFSLLTLFVAQGEDLQRYAAGARLQEDDRLSLEYSAPRALYGAYQQANVDRLRELAAAAPPPRAVREARAGATAVSWRNRGQMQLQADSAAFAYDDLLKALELNPADGEALAALAQAAARSGRLADAEKVLREFAAASRNPAASVQLSVVLSMQGRLAEATDTARAAVLTAPNDARALEQLASMFAERRDADALQRLASIVDQLAPTRNVGLYTRARLAYLHGDFARAAQLGDELAALDPANATALSLVGSSRAALGDHERARRALESARRLKPQDPIVLTNLGTIELRTANPAAAAERFSDALFVSPTLPAALDGLATALEQQGDTARAAAIRRRIATP